MRLVEVAGHAVAVAVDLPSTGLTVMAVTAPPAAGAAVAASVCWRRGPSVWPSE